MSRYFPFSTPVPHATPYGEIRHRRKQKPVLGALTSYPGQVLYIYKIIEEKTKDYLRITIDGRDRGCPIVRLLGTSRGTQRLRGQSLDCYEGGTEGQGGDGCTETKDAEFTVGDTTLRQLGRKGHGLPMLT